MSSLASQLAAKAAEIRRRTREWVEPLSPRPDLLEGTLDEVLAVLRKEE